MSDRYMTGNMQGSNRRYYKLTEKGRERLSLYKREWKQYAEKISDLFDGEEGQEEKMRGMEMK